MLSATFSKPVQLLTTNQLKPDYVYITTGVPGGTDADAYQVFHETKKSVKKTMLLEILREAHDIKIIIFVNDKITCWLPIFATIAIG